jgi:hypothetical protein
MDEDFYTLKNIIVKGLQKGFGPIRDKDIINSADLVEGNWVLSNGKNLGSTWDIILSPKFAEVFWGESYTEQLTKLVVMPSTERMEYIKQFVDTELDTSISDNPQDAFVVSNENLLMKILQESLIRLKEYSEPLYVESCNDTYNELQELDKKKSVTELSGNDFIYMNAMNRIMSFYGLAKYLNETGRGSFTLCPECGEIDFNHLRTCSITSQANTYLIDQNEGC